MSTGTGKNCFNRASAGESRKQSGFTLIELLVVISIISLLVSILLPVLATARQAAEATQCASRQRQIGLALMMYANDSDGYLPAYFDVNLPEYHQYWHSSIRRYIEPGDVFFCPSSSVPSLAQSQRTAAPASWNNMRVETFGLRRFRVPGTPASGSAQPLDQIASPSAFFIMSDSFSTALNHPGYFVIGGTTTGEQWRVSLRHNGQTANAIYADGHVARQGQTYFETVPHQHLEHGTTGPFTYFATQ